MARTDTLPPISSVPAGKEIPLAPAQQRLWLLDRLEGDTAADCMYAAFRLKGHLDCDSLCGALATLVRRHDSLRMYFPEENSRARVRLLAPYGPLLIDDRRSAPSVHSTAVDHWISRHVQTPFDLTKGPLLRVRLLRLTETEQILLLHLHQIVADHRSFRILLEELNRHYSACHDEQGIKPPPLTVQFSDYAHWQRRCRNSATLRKQLAYWQQQLAEIPEPLGLPADRPRPARPNFHSARITGRIDPKLETRLERSARRRDATLRMTLLSAFFVLLYRYTGQQDLCIGSPVNNRHRRYTADLIGPIANMLALRCRLDGRCSFTGLLAQIRRTCLDACAHKDLPFERLLEDLHPSRTLGHSPLFQVMFSLQNSLEEALRMRGLESSLFKASHVSAHPDLSLNIDRTGCGLMCVWSYDPELFDEERIQRMSGHYERLLTGIARDPGQAIGTLPLLTDTERNSIAAWNDTDIDHPCGQTIVALFEAQVEKSPDRAAVMFEGEYLSYRELNRKANRLAHWIQSTTKRRKILVGVCMRRSSEMVAALFGILKAGCAYVSLDPDFPKDRLAFMIEDSGASMLLTHSPLLTRLPEHSETMVCLDEQTLELQNQSDESLDRRCSPDDLAYVLYTSGSTGRPKGVMISHRSLAASTFARVHYYGIVPERFLLLSPLSFDSSVAGVFWTLSTGGRLILPRQDGHRDMEYLWTLIESERISHMLCVPSLHALLLEQQIPCKTEYLRTVIVAGEDIAQNLVNVHYQNLPHTRLYNEYGPTEATVWASVHAFKQTTQPQPISIGRPIANTHIHILDANRQQVPIGVPGELYISGLGLARGYLNRPDLTEEKFVRLMIDGSLIRVYKTGDMARWRADGNIEYLGRKDFQVKLRGYRIELGEIEATLLRHPAVNAAAVVMRADDGSTRLLAYVSARKSQSGKEAETLAGQLRVYLEANLPAYMIPSWITVLDALPLTLSGKLDRNALPEPLITNEKRGHTVPRNETELKLIEIWEAVLKVHPVGLEENFFELGGDSLIAVRLMSRIQKSFDQRLPPATLFQRPTVAQLAEIVHERRGSLQWDPLVPIRATGTNPPLFCLPGAGGNVLYFHALAGHLEREQPVYGLQTPGLDGKTTPHERIEDLAADHIETIKAAQPEGPYRLCGHSFGAHVAFEISLQMLERGEDVALLAIFDTPAPGATDLSFVPWVWDEAGWATLIAEIAGELLERDVGVDEQVLRQLPADEQLRFVNDRLQKTGWLAPGTDLAPLRGLIQVFKANVQTHYLPKNICPTKLTLFKAEQSHWSASGRALGWQQYTSEPVEEHTTPGGHISMLTSPQAEMLAQKLTLCIEYSGMQR